MNEFVLFSSGEVIGGAAKAATDTGNGLSTNTTNSTTMATSDIATASLSTMSRPHSSGDRSHDTTSQVTSHVTSQVTAGGDDLRTTMEALSSGGILSKKHAELLVSLLSTDDVSLLQRALVTIANAAAFTSNQVC